MIHNQDTLYAEVMSRVAFAKSYGQSYASLRGIHDAADEDEIATWTRLKGEGFSIRWGCFGEIVTWEASA